MLARRAAPRGTCAVTAFLLLTEPDLSVVKTALTAKKAVVRVNPPRVVPSCTSKVLHHLSAFTCRPTRTYLRRPCELRLRNLFLPMWLTRRSNGWLIVPRACMRPVDRKDQEPGRDQVQTIPERHHEPRDLFPARLQRRRAEWLRQRHPGRTVRPDFRPDAGAAL